jgi:hypothetical protein
MPSSTRRTRSTPASRRARSRRGPSSDGSRRSGKVRKAFWLDPKLLDDARAVLGTSSERETVEVALDLVAFRNELTRSARVLRGLALSRID